MDPQTAELPAYADISSQAPSREPVTHSVSLGGERGKAFATLNVVSLAPSAESQPVGFEGQPVVGSVDLNVEKETAFESITVTVSLSFTICFSTCKLMHNVHSFVATSWLETICGSPLSRLLRSYGPHHRESRVGP